MYKLWSIKAATKCLDSRFPRGWGYYLGFGSYRALDNSLRSANLLTLFFFFVFFSSYQHWWFTQRQTRQPKIPTLLHQSFSFALSKEERKKGRSIAQHHKSWRLGINLSRLPRLSWPHAMATHRQRPPQRPRAGSSPDLSPLTINSLSQESWTWISSSAVCNPASGHLRCAGSLAWANSSTEWWIERGGMSPDQPLN